MKTIVKLLAVVSGAIIAIALPLLAAADIGGSAKGGGAMAAADILTELLTVDTNDSTLNADTLDGAEGAAYALLAAALNSFDGDIMVGGGDIDFPNFTAATIGPSAPGSSLTIGSADGDLTLDGGNNLNLNAFEGSAIFKLAATTRLTIKPNGHLTSAASAATDAGTGTCASITVAGNDVRGTVTATCDAGETAIVDFGSDYTAAPVCSLSCADADCVAAAAHVTTTTGLLTITAVTGDADAAIYKYVCLE